MGPVVTLSRSLDVPFLQFSPGLRTCAEIAYKGVDGAAACPGARPTTATSPPRVLPLRRSWAKCCWALRSVFADY